MQIGSKDQRLVAGFVPKDAELTFVGEKKTPRTKFSVKVSGRNDEPVVWANIVAWRKWAIIASSIKKGDEVFVLGCVASREYNGQTYTDMTAEYIGLQPFAPDNVIPEQQTESTAPPPPELDEDLPF